MPQFEKATGHKVTTVFTGTLDANKRLAAGESYDLLIMASGSIDEHIKSGKVAAGSRVDLAKSGVGVGVQGRRAEARHQLGRGAEEDDAGREVDRLFHRAERHLHASALFEKLGIADQVKASSSRPRPACSSAPSSPAAKPRSASSRSASCRTFAGVDYVGPLPEEVQRYTMFSSGIVAGAKEPTPPRRW